MRLVPKRLRWMGLGALAAWLFDPDRGRARRNQIADKANELAEKSGLRPANSHGVTTSTGSAAMSAPHVPQPTATAAAGPPKY
jgi:hypothetical protein